MFVRVSLLWLLLAVVTPSLMFAHASHLVSLVSLVVRFLRFRLRVSCFCFFIAMLLLYSYVFVDCMLLLFLLFQ